MVTVSGTLKDLDVRMNTLKEMTGEMELKFEKEQRRDRNQYKLCPMFKTDYPHSRSEFSKCKTILCGLYNEEDEICGLIHRR